MEFIFDIDKEETNMFNSSLSFGWKKVLLGTFMAEIGLLKIKTSSNKSLSKFDNEFYNGAIKICEELKSIDNQLSVESFKIIQKHFKTIKILRNDIVNLEPIKFLKKIKKIEIVGESILTVEVLKFLPKIDSLTLKNTSITHKQIEDFKRDKPNCKVKIKNES